MKNVSKNELIQLQEALSHMHVKELKNQLEQLKLSTNAFNKNELINRLLHYATTGTELSPLKIPTVSQAKRGVCYPLDKKTLILHGAYKNDLKTRNFFKSLIGNHFHFTAQGIDWLRQQWLEGNPPTYEQFAQEWTKEFVRNQKEKRAPKQEWAYIRFVQSHLKLYPDATKAQLLKAWKAQRQEYVSLVHTIFNN